MTDNKYKFKGTPAPWGIFTTRPIGEYTIEGIEILPSAKRKSQLIASCWDRSKIGRNGHLQQEEAEHNAHLISAAPDLLEVCTKILMDIDSDEIAYRDIVELNTERLRSAIHKALNIQP